MQTRQTKLHSKIKNQYGFLSTQRSCANGGRIVFSNAICWILTRWVSEFDVTKPHDHFMWRAWLGWTRSTTSDRGSTCERSSSAQLLSSTLLIKLNKSPSIGSHMKLICRRVVALCLCRVHLSLSSSSSISGMLLCKPGITAGPPPPHPAVNVRRPSALTGNNFPCSCFWSWAGQIGIGFYVWARLLYPKK